MANREELVEKMCEADCNTREGPQWDVLKEISGEEWRKCMDAALSVAVEELLGNLDEEEWRKCARYSKTEFIYQMSFGDTNAFLASRRSRYSKPESVEERVTVSKHDTDYGDRWHVSIDGQFNEGFCFEKQAHIYRLGLIQQLKEQPK